MEYNFVPFKKRAAPALNPVNRGRFDYNLNRIKPSCGINASHLGCHSEISSFLVAEPFLLLSLTIYKPGSSSPGWNSLFTLPAKALKLS